MDDQTNLVFEPFNEEEQAREGARLREEGIDRATKNRVQRLKMVRAVARQLAQERGEISADDVSIYFYEQGTDLNDFIGNAAGSIFRGKDWEWTGRVRESVRASRHKNLIRIWRLARSRK